jgi:hypothetical protein
LSDGTNEAPGVGRADGQAAQEVRLKPDPTYGDRTDDAVDVPHDSADGESRGRDDEPR